MTAPMRPRLDGYGNPLPDPVWKGYTLDDLITYAQTGQPISTVAPGKTGYGLDQVGDANQYQPGASSGGGFDWKKAVGAALAGLANTQPGAGAANLGRGFVSGQEYQDNAEMERRRNALTDSQIAHQQAETDLAGLKVLDYPTDRAREADQFTTNQDYRQSMTEENRTRIAAILAGEARDAELQPYNIDVKKAQAENYRETSGGRQPTNRDDWIANKAAVLMARAQYDEDGYRTAGLDPQDAIRMATELWASTHAGGAAVRGKPAAPGSVTFGGAPMPGAGRQPTTAPSAKISITQQEYDAITEDRGAAYAARYFTVGQ